MSFSDAQGYQAVAAGQTDKVLGTAGASGDLLSYFIIQPTTTAASAIVKDSSTAVFTLTAGTLADLSPKIIPWNARSRNGAWSVTTVNCTMTLFGSFS